MAASNTTLQNGDLVESDTARTFEVVTVIALNATFAFIVLQVMALSCTIIAHLESRNRLLLDNLRSRQRLLIASVLTGTLLYDVCHVFILKHDFGHSEHFDEESASCRWVINLLAFSVSLALFSSYLFLYQRMRMVDAGMTGKRYLLLRKVVLVFTCSYIFTFLLSRFFVEGKLEPVDPTSQAPASVCLPDVPPYLSLCVLFLDSTLSCGFLALFLWPLVENLRLAKSQRAQIHKAVRQNLNVSIIAIGSTAVALSFLAGVSSFAKDKASYATLMQIATIVVGIDIKTNACTMLYVTNCWKPWGKKDRRATAPRSNRVAPRTREKPPTNPNQKSDKQRPPTTVKSPMSPRQ